MEKENFSDKNSEKERRMKKVSEWISDLEAKNVLTPEEEKELSGLHEELKKLEEEI